MTDRFDDRLDPSFLHIDRAKILESESKAETDDSSITIIFSIAEGLYEEGKTWLKENQLIYTDPTLDFHSFQGVYRTDKIFYSKKQNGLVVVLRKGYYQSLDWDASVISSFRSRPAGANTELQYGDEEERYVLFDFKYIDKDYVDAVVTSVPSTKSDLSLSPSGTWYLIDATSAESDDGTHTVKALYANVSGFSIAGWDTYEVPGGSSIYQFSGIPKQLAQSLCDLYMESGNSVYPSFSYGSGLCDIRIEKAEKDWSITISGLLVEKGCQSSVTRTYYFGKDSVPTDVSASSQGVINRLGGIYIQKNGTYNYYIETQTAIAASKSGSTLSSERSSEETTEYVNAKSLASISASTGHIKRSSFKINQDCTYDQTVSDETISDQEVASHVSQISPYSTIEDESHTSSSSMASAGTAVVGEIVSVSNEKTPEGTYRTGKKTVTSTEAQTGTEVSIEQLARRTTSQDRYINQRTDVAIPEYTSPGTVYSKNVKDNQDGTLDVEISTIVSEEAQTATANVVEVGQYSKTTQDRYLNQASDVAVSATPVQGVITSKRAVDNQDGTTDITVNTSTSVAATPITAQTIGKSAYTEKTFTETINSRTIPAVSAPATGTTVDISLSTNQDGTFNIRRSDETKSEIEHCAAVVVQKNTGIAVTQNKVSNTTGAVPDISTPIQGSTKTLSKTINDDGTIDYVENVEEEADLFINASAPAHDLYRGDALSTVTEVGHTGAVAEVADVAYSTEGVVTEVQNTPKQNGLFRTLLRVRTSIEKVISAFTSAIDALSSTSRTIGLNVRAANVPTITHTSGHLKTLSKEANEDGTTNYVLVDETVIDGTGYEGIASPLFIEDVATHTESTAITTPGSATAGVIKSVTSRPTRSGLFATTSSEKIATEVAGSAIVVSDNPFFSEEFKEVLNTDTPIAASAGTNETIDSRVSLNEFGLYDQRTSTRTPKQDVGEFSTGFDSGANADYTEKSFVLRNASTPTIEAESGKVVEGRITLNENGLWDVSKSVKTPVVPTLSAVVTQISGQVKVTTTVYKNQDTLEAATANGVVIDGINYNAFGKWDYTKKVYEPSSTPSYTYYYYGPIVTVDLSTRTAYSRVITDATSTPRTVYSYYLTSPLLETKRKKYTVVVTYYSSASAAQTGINGGSEGSGISQGDGGLFKGTKVTWVWEAA